MVALVGGNSFGLQNSSAGTLGQNGLFGNALFGSAKEKAFLNVSNGNLTLQNADGFIANTGIDVALTRTYNSLGKLTSGFGQQWTDGLADLGGLPANPDNAAELASAAVTRTAADGSIARFTYDAQRGAYTSTDGGGAYQTVRYDRTLKQWIWSGERDDLNGVHERYDGAGRLVAAADKAGIRISYTYDTLNRLQTIVNGNDRTTFTYSANADGSSTVGISQTLSGGAATIRTSYTLDALGRLARVQTAGVGAGYAVNYSYDGNSERIRTVSHSDGATLTAGYDQQGRVVQLLEHDNSGVPDRTTALTYLINADGTLSTTVQDGAGTRTQYVSDSRGRLQSVTTPVTGGAPVKITYTYNGRDDVVTVSDGSGRVTRYDYDSQGNRVAEFHADGSTVLRTYASLNTANPGARFGNQLLTESLIPAPVQNGGAIAPVPTLTARYVLNSAGQVRYAITPQGRVTEYTYNADGQVMREWTFLSSVYNIAALQSGAVPSESAVQSWAATATNLISRTDYTHVRGRVATSTRYANAPASSAAGSGAVTTAFTYDLAGNLLAAQDGNRNTTQYTYDAFGRPLTRTDASGTTQYVYAGESASATTIDPSGMRTVRIYDSSGRLVSTTQAGGKLMLVTRNVYDAAGRLSMSIDQAGQQTAWKYDEAGRKTAEIGPDGAFTEYVYGAGSDLQPARVIHYFNRVADPLDEPIPSPTPIPSPSAVRARIDENDDVRAVVRQTDNRPQSTAFDRSTAFYYDAAGRTLAEVDPEGYLTRYVYDGAGRLVRTIARAEPVSATQRDQAALWPIDADVASPKDRIVETAYDADGKAILTIDALGNRTEYTYNGAGLLTGTVKLGSGTAIREYVVYDGLGRMVASVDGDNYVTEIRYDANGNVARRIRYGAPSNTPAAGTLAGITQGLSATHPDLRATTYTYTALDQLLTESTSDAAGATIGLSTTYAYDKAGNVTSVTRTNGIASSAEYDALGRLVTEFAYAGAAPVRHAYDSAGRRISTTDQNGNRTLFYYDAAGRLTFSVNPLGEVSERRYDNFGALASERRYGERFQAQRLATLGGGNANYFAPPAAAMSDSRTYYHYDGNGRLRYTVNGAGDATEQRYNAFGQTESVMRYSSALSAKTMAELSGGLPTQALTEALKNGAAEVTRIAFDANGRLSYTINGAGGAESRDYDAFGRLTEVRSHDRTTNGAPLDSATDSVVTYAYDARGNVVRQTDAAHALTITHNAHGQATAVSRAGNWVGATSAGAILALQNVTERTFYDREGRMVGTIDAAGAVTVLRYDANSNLIERLTWATPVDQAVAAGATAATLDTLVKTATASDTRNLYFYDTGGRLIATLTASAGNSWTVQSNTYDAVGNLTELRTLANAMILGAGVTPTLGNTIAWIVTGPAANDAVQRMVYDGAGRLIATATRQHDARWSVSAQQYDSSGRITLRTAYGTALVSAAPFDAEILATPAGADAITAYRYDQAGRVLASATAQSIGMEDGRLTVRWALTTKRYDGLGRMVQQTRHADSIATDKRLYDFNAALVTNPGDRIDQYLYNSAGRLAATIGPTGQVTGLVYDARGNLASSTAYSQPYSGNNALPTATPADRITRTIYNRNNQPVIVIDAGGAVTEREYDALGKVTRVTRYAEPLQGALPAEPGVADVARLLKPDPADRTERFHYDAAGRLRFAVDPAGYLTETRYDALGRATSERAYQAPLAAGLGLENIAAAVSAQSGGANGPRTTSWTYNARGDVLSKTDARAMVETYTHDALGNRLTLSKRPDAASVPLVWNYIWDAAGRLLSETTPQVDIYAAPATEPAAGWGSLAPVRGSLTTSYQYDALGNLQQRTEGVAGAGGGRITRYGYDLAGRQVVTMLPDAQVYDAGASRGENARTEKTVAGLTIEVTYNSFGDAVTNKDLGGNRTYKFYDLRGQVVRDVDAMLGATSYKRNAFGEVELLTRHAMPLNRYDEAIKENPADRAIRTDYDVRGQALRVTEPTVTINDGHMLAGMTQHSAARTTISTYNAFGETIQRDVVGSNAQGVAVTAAASTRFYYDVRGDQRAEIAVSGYNDGKPAGYLTTFRYDDGGRVLERKEHGNLLASWSPAWAWSDASAPVTPHPTDRTVSYTYDALGNKRTERLTGLQTDATTSYAYDDFGRVRSTTDAAGVKNVTYYDALGRTTGTALIERTADASQSMPMSEFRLDAFGNVVVRIDYSGSVPDGLAETTRPAMTYDKEKDRVAVNLYDAQGRLTTSIDAAGRPAHTSYDVLGRIAKQWRMVNEGTAYAQTAFEVRNYDALGRLKQVIQPGNINALSGARVEDTLRTLDYNAFGEVTTSTLHSGAVLLRTETTHYDNAGRAWLSNGGDGIWRATLYDARGNATASFTSAADARDSLTSLTTAVQVLGRADVRRVDTRYDMLGHVVDVSQSYAPNHFFLQREPDGSWIRTAYDPARPEVDGLLLLGDRHDASSAFDVRFRLKGSTDWQRAPQRLGWIDGYPVFNTGALAQGVWELAITVQPETGAAFQLDTVELNIVAEPGSRKIGQLIALYLALQQRTPDPEGLNYWMGRLNEGSTLGQIANEMITNPDTVAKTGAGTPNVLKYVLTKALGYSEGTPEFSAALQRWSALYDEQTFGKTNHGQVLVDLVKEHEARLATRVAVAQAYLTEGGGVAETAAHLQELATKDPQAALAQAAAAGAGERRQMQLVRLYIAVLGRAPDPVGFNFYKNGMATGATLLQIAQSLLDSAEMRAVLPVAGLSEAQQHEQFVKRAYASLTGRTPTGAELGAALAALAEGGAAKWVLGVTDRVAGYDGADAAAIADRRTSFSKTVLGLAYAAMDMGAIDVPTQIEIARVLLQGSAPNTSVAIAAEQAKLKVQAQLLSQGVNLDAAMLAAGGRPLEALQLRLARMYVAVLGRAPDRSGYGFWLEALASGASTLEIVVADMLAGEGAAPGASDEQFVRDLYQRAFGAPIGAEMLRHWSGEAARNGRAATAIALVGQVLADADPALEPQRELFHRRTAAGMTYVLYMNGNDLTVARSMLAKVTATDSAAAIDSAYRASDALAAAAAAETATAARNAAKLMNDAAAAALALMRGELSLDQAEALAAANPMARPLLSAARLYVGLLGRGAGGAPLDAKGLINLAADIAAKGDVAMAQFMLASDEGVGLYPAGISNGDFITRIYDKVLGRAPDPAGLAAWTRNLVAGQSRAAVAVAILDGFIDGHVANEDPLKDDNLIGLKAFHGRIAAALGDVAKAATAYGSTAATALDAATRAQEAAQAFTAATNAHAAAVRYAAGTNAQATLNLTRLYVGVLNRPLSYGDLDYTGMTFWTRALVYNHDTPATIAQKFIDSEEGKRLYAGAATAEQFVAQIYRQVHGREPDAGAAFWIAQLKNGSATRGQLAWSIIDSLMNNTQELASEYNGKANFNTRVANAARTYGSAYATQAGIAGAANETAAALTALNTANSNLSARQAELNATSNLNAASDPSVRAALAGRAFYNSPYRDSLQELLTAFGRSTSYATVESLLVDLGAGRLSLAQIAGQSAGAMGDKRSFYTNLYWQVLRRAPDADGLNWWAAQPHADPGVAAYEFFRAALVELYGPQTSYRQRNYFASEVSAVTSANNQRARALSDSYASALATAQASIDNRRSQAQSAYYAAQTAVSQANTAYQDKRALGEVARTTQATITTVVTIQEQAAYADRAGANAMTWAATARSAALGLNAAGASWSMDRIIQESTPRANASGALPADQALSQALADLAGANLQLLLSQQQIGAADAASRGVIGAVQLFTVLFGPNRLPTLAELNSIVIQLRDGATLADIAASLTGRDAALGAMSNSVFIDTLYRNAGGRAVDAAGLAFWLKAQAGPPAMTRGELVAGFINSLVIGTLNDDTATFHGAVSKSMATLSKNAQAAQASPDTAAFVHALALALGDVRARKDAAAQAALTPQARYAIEITQLYVTLLERIPEPSALLSAIESRRQGRSFEAIAGDILASDEIQGKLARTLDNPAFVDALFAQALGRAPAADERAALLGKLARAELTRAQLVTGLIADTDAYRGGDAQILAGRELLGARIDTALAQGAAALTRYFAALGQNGFDKRLGDALNAAAQRYVDIHRSVLESTTTGAAVLHTAPDRMRVDRWGNTLSVNDPRDPNAQTRTTYNANNQVLETTLPAVARPAGTDDGVLKMVNTYDHAGRLLSAAKIAADGKLVYTTRYQYDDKGALKREDHADGGYTTYTSDVFGQRLTSTQYLNASQSVTYSYTYDRLGNLATRTSAPVTVYDWDGSANGKTATFQNARRIVDAYTYDELGRRTSTANYSTDTNGARYGSTIISALRYDVGGNIILSTDGNGLRTLRVYDALGNKHIEREASAYDPGSGEARLQHWNHDGFGRLQSYIDLAGNVTDNVYNAAGQLAVSVQLDANKNQMRRTSYEYEGGTGFLVKVLDTNFVNGQNLQQLARYSYDRAGNRITEQTWLMGTDGQLQRALQDHVLAYDKRNQLTRITSSVSGADYRIAYAYDAFGNREQVTTEYTNDIGHKKTITVNYKFDAMDRVTEVSGNVDTLYDKPVYIPPSRTPIRNDKHDTYYEELPGDIGHYEPGDNAPIEKHVITYNWAGNRASDNNETYQYDALGRLSEIRLGGSVTGYRRYDSVGRVIEARNGAEVQLNDYDAGGRVTFQRTQNQSNGDQRSRVTYYYDADLGLLNLTTAQGASNGKLQHTTNTWNELRGTRLLSTTTVSNAGTSDYKTNTMQYDIGGVMSRVTAQVYANNKLSDDTVSSRTMISDYNGQLLEKTQNGLRTHVLLANGRMIGENSASHETFSTVHEGLSTSTDANVSVYVVQSAGEKLTSIAKAIWGDERLWYLIADANGLTFSATLTVGQPLTIPASAGASYNGADTFKPYNAGEIIGSTTPEMALPVPQQSGGGCGGLGQLVMVVVAVVATIYTAGLAAGALSVSAAGTSAWAAGAAVMTGGYGFGAGVIAAGAIGGAVGSIASQAVGIAIGAQDGFNWKGVALSAIGGGVSAGVAGAASQGALSKALMGSQWEAVAARAALGNVVTQGVSVATGLQNSFSWRGVAASAAGAAVGAQANSYLGGDNALGSLFKGNEISRATVVGFVAGTTTAVARGGKIDIIRIATDAFGNALGESLVDSISRPSLASSMRNLPQDQQDRMLDMAQKAGLNAWSSDEKYEIIKRAADLRFDPDAQNLSTGQRLARTSDYLSLIGATDEQISAVNRNYAAAGIGDKSHWQSVQVGDAAATAGVSVQAKSFLGSAALDDGVIGVGNVVTKFGQFVDSNPIAKYTLEGLDIISGPVMYGIRHIPAVEALTSAAIGKVAGFFGDGFSEAGRVDTDVQYGAAGGVTVLAVGATGFAGAAKGLRSLAPDFNFRRFDVSHNPFGAELSQGAKILALPTQVNPEKFVASVHSALRTKANTGELGAFKARDPNAKIGLTGSSATGRVGNPNKATFGQPINAEKFDLDLFVQSDKLLEQFGPKLRTAPDLRQSLVDEFPEIFSGLKPGKDGLSIKFRPNGPVPQGSIIFP